MNVNMQGAPSMGSRQIFGIIAFIIILIALIVAVKIIFSSLTFGPELYWFIFKITCGVLGSFGVLFLIYNSAEDLPEEDINS